MVALLLWIGPEDVVRRLAEISPPVALAGFAGALLTQWLGAVRLARIGRSLGVPVATREALSINLSVVFYGLFVPGGSATGWAIRLLRLSRQKGSFGSAVRALTIDRALATATLAAIGLWADLVLRSPGTLAVSALLAVAAVGAALPAIFLLFPPARSIQRLAQRVRLARRLRELLARCEAPESGDTARLATGAAVLSVCMHLVGILVWLLLARTLGIDADLIVIAWARSVSMLVALMPASVGGLGLRESALLYLLAFFGVPGADAISLSLSVFAVTIVAVALVGAMVELWALLGRRRSSSDP